MNVHNLFIKKNILPLISGLPSRDEGDDLFISILCMDF